MLGQAVELNTVLAGFHYDLNFLTVHGKSRFPGLKVWTRAGHVVVPKIPPGHLFLQAGKQFEYLTGGHVLAGFHEVIAHKACAKAARDAKRDGRSTARVVDGSQIASDVVLEPLGAFDSADARAAYPPIKTGDQVQAARRHPSARSETARAALIWLFS
ncbi:dioxygenase [Aureococcus anophagefferens]|nr:dioxygenase [Aureococcus anophagefferens]